MSPAGWVAFLCAAGVGAAARAVVSFEVQRRSATMHPWGTAVVNVVGCFLAGLVAGLVLHQGLDAQVARVVAVGFAGSFTTFSTFTYETVRLAETGAWSAATTNVVGSLVTGGAAGAIGLAVPALW